MSFAPFCSGEMRARSSAATKLKKPALSLLAMVVTSAISAQSLAAETAKTDAQQTLVVNANSDASNSDTPQPTDYSAPVTTSGTKLTLTPREVPQSVSIITQQRMEDQQLQSVGEVLSNTTGVTQYAIDSDRSTFYSRGFHINNYLYDDIPTSVDKVWNFGDAGADTAIYDRIEVVRGATGLMTGAGNPSASVNMVRKHADSREFQGSVSGSYGTWDKQRYVMDLSAPLSQSGDVRGRVIAGYQDNDSWLDRYHYQKKFLYGVMDADLTDATTVSLGYEFQESNTEDPTWGGLPTWYSDGSRTHYDRSFNAAPDWSYTDTESRKVFATLTQRFDNGWQFRVNGTHAETTFDSKLMYGFNFPDKETGAGVAGSGGWNKGKRKVDAVDSYASGPFELFGRSHELVAGVSYSKQHNRYYNTWANIDAADMGNYNDWNGSVAEVDWPAFTDYQNDTIRQKSAYSAVRFSLADPLHLLLGARYTDWRASGTTQTSKQDEVTPYAGLIYDINDTYSVYASYTSIFQPQSETDANGNYLDPIKGNNYETGLKADWFNGRLTSSLALFRIEQDNVAVTDGTYRPGTNQLIYRGADGAVSRGVDFEINGAVTDNLQMTFGATRYIAEERDGTAVMPQLPRTSLKLFTRYQLPMLPDLAVGGGVNWQNHTWSEDAAGPQNQNYVDQGSYALVNLFARYQVTKQFSLQANVNNLFDKTYYSYLSSYAVYGAPRSVSVMANYKF